MTIAMRRLDAPFGARVEGWAPGSPISPEEAAKLRSSLQEHLILLFRGHPKVGDEDLANLGRCFGVLAVVVDPAAGVRRHPNILCVSNEPDGKGNMRGVAGSGVLPWHIDYSFTVRPAEVTLLEAKVVPEDRGATYFCNLYRAWDRLDASQKDMLSGLRARHFAGGREQDSVHADGQTNRGEYEAARLAEETEAERIQTNQERWDPSYHPHHAMKLANLPAWHPLAFENSENGRTALYISSLITEIEGLDEAGAAELRDSLIMQATNANNVYRHEWQEGDLIVFDAIGGLHRRDSFDRGQLRTMRQLSTLLAEQ